MGLINHLRPALEDRYRIEAEIGSGGMATVFRAQDLKHDRTVAIKVLKEELAQSVGADRFLQEIRIVAKLQHPHILSLLDSGEVDGTLYYVMPFVQGQSLREKLNRENELPVSDALHILGEVADALAFAHQHGVVHRDIKPDNVLMAGRHALVADFGVSKAIDAAMGSARVTTTGMAIGTPAYMAPEQAVGSEVVDHRADIYALGIVGYELLTGHPPFQGRTPQQILGAKLAGHVATVTELRPAVPPAVSKILMRCLEERPADRWQTAEELREQLEFGHAPTSEIRPWGVALARRSDARRWKVAGAAALGVVILGGAAWTLLRGAPSPSTSANGLPAVPTLAVLPFENYGGDSAQAYLADGVTEQMTAALAKISGLHVLSRTSAERFRGDRPPIREIGRALHADLIMEGSVMEVGEKLRITPQLIVASTDQHMWAGTYDGNLADFLSLLSDVARAVASEVKIALTREDRKRLAVAPTTSPQVMSAVLRARTLVDKGDGESAAQAIRLLEPALDLDPSFAPAWGLLANAELNQIGWWGGADPEATMPLVERNVHRALALDLGDIDAQFALGQVHDFNLQWEDGLRAYRAVLARDPSYSAVGMMLTNHLTWMGRYEEAEAQARKTVALDPLLADAYLELANVLLESRRSQELFGPLGRALELDPEHPMLRALVPAYLAFSGHCDGPGDLLPKDLGLRDAVSEEERVLAQTQDQKLIPLRMAIAAVVFTLCGRPDRAQDMFRAMEARAGTQYVSPLLRARTRVWTGHMDGLLDLLEEGLRGRDASLIILTNAESFQPLRDSLRDNPRFEHIIDEIGVPRSPLKWGPAAAGGHGSR